DRHEGNKRKSAYRYIEKLLPEGVNRRGTVMPTRHHEQHECSRCNKPYSHILHRLVDIFKCEIVVNQPGYNSSRYNNNGINAGNSVRNRAAVKAQFAIY